MQGHEFIINGKPDLELTSVTLWFALTYLYSINCNPNEKRYQFAPTYQTRISKIKNCSQNKLYSWVQYALQGQLKQSTNSGGVSIKEQQLFAQQLLALPHIKVM